MKPQNNSGAVVIMISKVAEVPTVGSASLPNQDCQACHVCGLRITEKDVVYGR